MLAYLLIMYSVKEEMQVLVDKFAKEKGKVDLPAKIVDSKVGSMGMHTHQAIPSV
jgi:hypothetical protein